MEFSKPSKKIIILIVIAVTIIGFAIFTKFYKTQAILTATPKAIEEQHDTFDYTDNKKNIDTLDTDSDGLADWQEIISGTDLNNPDTDGDGTEDGKEVELNRDPIIKGPNDQRTNTPNNITLGTSTTNMTISEAVSKSLFANTVYLSNNENVTEDNVTNLVNNLINGVQNDFTFREYSIANLPTISIETKENIRFFASAFASLQYALLDELAKNQDMEFLAKVYNKHAEALYSIPTPKEIAPVQIQIINNFSKTASVYEALAKQKEDPLKLPLAMKAYQEAGAEQEGLVISVGQYLNKSDIIDSLEESAKNYWTLAITE